MPYWTTKNYLSAATNRLTRDPGVKRNVALHRCALHSCALLLATLLLLSPSSLFADSAPDILDPVSAVSPSPVTLTPYTAVYISSIRGISAEMEQTLGSIGDHQWLMRNTVSIMWASIEEKAQFSESNGKLKPATYHYSNKLSSKRSSALIFDWNNMSVTDTLHSKTPLTLTENALDKLSFQTQLRLNLLTHRALNQNKPLTENSYQLVDRTQYKTYNVKYLGDEIIETPAGKFNAIKIQQRRPGKDKHTLVWLATDWDYFILRIQRVEPGKNNDPIELKQALINGKKIQGLSP